MKTKFKKRKQELSDSDKIKNTIVERAIFTNECLTDTDWGYLLDRALLHEYTFYEEELQRYHNRSDLDDYDSWYDVVSAYNSCVVLYNYLKKIWPDTAEAYKSVCPLSPLPGALYHHYIKECPWLDNIRCSLGGTSPQDFGFTPEVGP